MKELKFWHRENQEMMKELVFGEDALRWVHNSPLGRFLMHFLFCRKFVSKVYGSLQSTQTSAQKVQPFVKKYQINMDDFEPKSYTSFNDFFIRKFKAGKRKWENVDEVMPAPAEARYLAFSKVDQTTQFPIKGMSLNFKQLLNHHPLSGRFKYGPALIARLCPTDYHRFHFPDDGKLVETFHAGTKLYSVSPFALEMKGDILETNERQISFLETKNFGLLAYVEVGALFVGQIIQSHESLQFKRGDEKGFFLFGGSTVVVLGEAGIWRPDQDLLDQTAAGIETWCKIGSACAKRL